MIKKLYTIEDYLQELKEKSSISISIPDNKLISEAEQLFTSEDELQRFYLFLYHTFTLRRSYILSPFKYNHSDVLISYEMILYSDFIRSILSQNETTRNHILLVLKDLNIIKMSRQIDLNKYNAKLNVYLFNESITNTSFYKTVKINKIKVLNANFNYIFNRYNKLNEVHKKILNNNIIKTSIEINKDEFNKKYYIPTLEDKKTCDIPNEKNSDGSRKKKLSRAEYVKNFEEYSISMWNSIEDINSEIKFLRFLNCKTEDTYGHRFFHTFINIPKKLRWNFRMDKTHVLKPLFEIDLIASQPTFNALLMEKEGFIDEEYYKDVSSIEPDFYNILCKKFKKNISRDLCKEMTMQLLFGKINSASFKRAMEFYPTMTKYLSIKKSRTYEQLIDELTEVDHFKYSSSNCMDLQRAESLWTSKVWVKLIENKVRFIPIHDSVIIFGNKNLDEQEVKSLSRKISKLMLDCFELKTNSKVTPHLKTKFNPELYPITNEEIY